MMAALVERHGQTTASLSVFDPWMYKWLSQTRLLMRHHQVPWDGVIRRRDGRPAQGGEYPMLFGDRLVWETPDTQTSKP